MKAELIRYLRAHAVAPLVFLLLGGITQGIAFVALVPIIRDLFTPGMPIAWAWVGVLLGVTAVHIVLHYSSVPMGNKLGTGMVAALHRVLADRATKAPASAFDPSYADQLASLDGPAVVVLMGLPGHVLRPLVAAVATPLTVIVIMLFVQPALAGGLAAGAVLLVVVGIVLARLAANSADADGAEWLRRAFEPVRAWPRSPARVVVGEALLRRAAALAACGAVAACVALFLGGGLTAGGAVAFVVLSMLTFQPTAEAVLLSSTVLKALEVLARIGRLIDLAGREQPAAGWPEQADVEFDGVGVTLDAVPILSGATFGIPAGTTAGVVGVPDGTRRLLGDLLTGVLRPTTGRVRIGGVDVHTIAPAELDRRLCHICAPVPDATAEQARHVLDRLPASVPSCVLSNAERLRAALAAGLELSEADRWRLALLRGWSGEARVAVVDTTGTGVFDSDPDLAGLLAGFADGRTCLLVAATEAAVPASADIVVVRGAEVGSGLLTSRRE
jgi:ABC-type multidrug transport system fused ATPase/permease subunit